MKRIIIATTAAVSLTAIACSSSDTTSAPASALAVTMASAFSAAPAGYSNLNSSYVGDEGVSFAPDFGRDDDHHSGLHFGMRGIGPGFGLGFMGGGVFGGFMGNGFARAVFAASDSSCHFANGIVTCDPRTAFGRTVTRTYEFKDSTGTAQPKFDMNTTSLTSTVTVHGSSTRRDSSTSSVDLSSTQSVSGLGRNSTGLTLNSASSGVEQASGVSREGPFTAKRTAADTVQGVVIPFPSGSHLFPFPTAGTITRSMSVDVTISGQSKVSASRREVITYDGSDTAKVVITLDGETQNCLLPLPFGHLKCS